MIVCNRCREPIFGTSPRVHPQAGGDDLTFHIFCFVAEPREVAEDGALEAQTQDAQHV